MSDGDPALFSDMHGNRLALEAVLDDMKAREITEAYCLGDLVGYGPDPNGVIDLLRGRWHPEHPRQLRRRRRLGDRRLRLLLSRTEAKRIGEASYAFTVATVTAESKASSAPCPGSCTWTSPAEKVHLVHGSPRRINEYLLRDRDERTYLRLAESEADDVLAFGHTHDPWFRRYGGKLFVNVGSVGRPKDGDPRAMYVALRSSTEGPMDVEMRRVAYDVEAAAEAVIAVGLPDTLAAMLRRGS